MAIPAQSHQVWDELIAFFHDPVQGFAENNFERGRRAAFVSHCSAENHEPIGGMGLVEGDQVGGNVLVHGGKGFLSLGK